MTRSRNNFRLSAIIAASFAMISALFWLQYETLKARSPLAVGTLELLSADQSNQFPPEIAAKAKKRLAEFPNDQAALNLLLVASAKSGVGDSEIQKMLSLLSKLGWRNSAVQQNLIAESVKTQNFEVLINSADALLRRGQGMEQILELLSLIEVEPKVQPVLVERLKHKPNWEKDFLAKVDHLTTDEKIAARAKTLNLMFDAGQEIARADLAPSLNALVKQQKFDAALKIFRKVSQDKTTGIVNDSNFRTLANVSDVQYFRPFPFEWTKYEKRGLQISAYDTVGNGEVKIRWNGRGTPLMLSQYVQVNDGQTYSIEVSGLDASEQLLRRLQFWLSCKHATVRFDQDIKEFKSNRLRLISSKSVPCEFPRLEIRGRVQDGNQPVEISLSSIKVIPTQ